MIKQCADCGNEFYAEHYQRRLCDSCAALHAMLTQKEASKKAKKKRANTVKICAWCGKEYSGRRSKYCSDLCKSKALSKGKQTKEIKCLQCGKTIIVPLNNRTKYCSAACANEAQCENAEKRFTPKSLNRPFTDETAYLIKLWHEKGDSAEKIALALGRNVEAVKQVLENGKTLQEEYDASYKEKPLEEWQL